MIEEEFLQLGRPSTSLSDGQVGQLERLTQVGKDFLSQQLYAWLAEHRRDPIVCSYGADLTPLTTVEHYTSQCASHNVTRKGRACQEFLIQRWFFALRTDPPLVLLQEPLIFTDKTDKSVL